MSFASRVHDSLQYNATGHTSVFSLILVWMPRVRSFHMVVSGRNANLAAPRRARISVLQVADSSTMDSKYLNLSTCSSTAAWHVMLCFLFFCSSGNLRLFCADLLTKFCWYPIYFIQLAVVVAPPVMLLLITLSNLTDFQNFCTAGKRKKFATKPRWHCPPHLRHVATLAWDVHTYPTEFICRHSHNIFRIEVERYWGYRTACLTPVCMENQLVSSSSILTAASWPALYNLFMTLLSHWNPSASMHSIVLSVGQSQTLLIVYVHARSPVVFSSFVWCSESVFARYFAVCICAHFGVEMSSNHQNILAWAFIYRVLHCCVRMYLSLSSASCVGQLVHTHVEWWRIYTNLYYYGCPM